MTDQRDKLIDSILEQYSVWEYRRAFHLAMRALLKRELSDKLILDRKQLEEMIENASDSADLYWKAILVKDLNSLLPNQANDSD